MSSYSTPRSLKAFCKAALPVLYGRTDGQRILNSVAAIVETDRWNSFDRFHDTTQTLVREYETAGATVEVYTIPTGGTTGSGRWIIQEAADIYTATVDVIQPVQQRILNYRDNPWHVIQWSAGTPKDGMINELTIVDSTEELDRTPNDGLAGKIVLTSMEPRTLLKQLVAKGACGVITDRPVQNLPSATAWTKFGWGAIPLDQGDARLVGLVMPEYKGKKLRQLMQEYGRLVLHTTVDVRQYAGSHDLVSGVIPGRDDPQDEIWVLAHSAEPGAVDNASGVAVCLEIARVIEGLIADGRLPRPRRSIRLLNGYECYGFFHYLEHVRRLQVPLAGVCIDTLGTKPEVCDGRLSWRATIPMSAGFVDRVGETIIRAALRLGEPGYRFFSGSFVSTSDTLIGDPKYGFPCPWLTTHYRKKGVYNAYHSSADMIELLSPRGLETCTVAMAGYLYYLADAGNREVMELATAETGRTLKQLQDSHEKVSSAEVRYVLDAHQVSINRLKRWMWGGNRSEIFSHLADCERQVREVAGIRAKQGMRRRIVPGANRIPRRIAPLSPTLDNTSSQIAEQIRASKLAAWALFWANSNRRLADIAEAISCEQKKEVTVEQVITFFEAHAELRYVELIEPEDMVSQAQIISDLKALGVGSGIDVMVHSSLSKIGHVIGGADTVVDALLSVIGKRGTLMMPSFNHSAALIFNPMTTPTTNGAIPDAIWRHPEAVRSIHPTHAVAAIGPKAEAFCRGHLEIGIWEQDSPIGRLIHGGGHILSLGVTHDATTAYHVAENSVPCRCIDPFGSNDNIVEPDGTVRRVRGLAWRSATCPVPPSMLGETLDQRSLQRHGMVGHAYATLVKAIDLWNVRREHLKDVCPTCTIKPRARR